MILIEYQTNFLIAKVTQQDKLYNLMKLKISYPDRTDQVWVR